MTDPKLAAAVVLLRGAEGGPEVYLVRRHPNLTFLGGFHAFPGGTLDNVDAQVKVANDPLPAGFCSAAARELFEETGVLIATGAARLSVGERAAMRKALLSDARLWRRLLDEHRLTLDGSDWLPMGMWLTPPYSALRFRAHYVAAWLPEGQAADIWPGELTEGEWVPVSDAVARHNRAELRITYPVLETLKVLAEHR